LTKTATMPTRRLATGNRSRVSIRSLPCKNLPHIQLAHRAKFGCWFSYYRRLGSGSVHCAGSATYQVTDPEPEPNSNHNPNPKNKIIPNDTGIKFNIELYIYNISLRTGVGLSEAHKRNRKFIHIGRIRVQDMSFSYCAVRARRRSQKSGDARAPPP